MNSTKRSMWAGLLLGLALSPACASTDASSPSKGDETDVAADGKLDGVSVVDHGSIRLVRAPAPRGQLAAIGSDAAELTTSARTHAWEFDLSGEADIRLSVSVRRNGNLNLDTVMYLYRQDQSGRWGRYIRRNDDAGGNSTTPYLSTIDEGSLSQGTYRVVIKGYSRSEVGAFQLNARCEGAGCVIPEVSDSSCLEGKDIADLTELARFETTPARGIHANTNVAALTLRQILKAVNDHAESLGDEGGFDTLSGALDYVDQNVLWTWNVTDTETDRTFTVVEFAKGDTLVGSLFEHQTSTVVATIADSEIVAASGQDLCQ